MFNVRSCPLCSLLYPQCPAQDLAYCGRWTNDLQCTGVCRATVGLLSEHTHTEGRGNAQVRGKVPNKATSAKITNAASAWRVTTHMLPICSDYSSLWRNDFHQPCSGCQTITPLTHLPLALTTVGVLRVSSGKPDIKEIWKNVKQHHSSHGFIIVIFIRTTNCFMFSRLNFYYRKMVEYRKLCVSLKTKRTKCCILQAHPCVKPRRGQPGRA